MSNQSIYQRAVKVIPGGVSRNTIFRYPHPFYVDKAKEVLLLILKELSV